MSVYVPQKRQSKDEDNDFLTQVSKPVALLSSVATIAKPFMSTAPQETWQAGLDRAIEKQKAMDAAKVGVDTAQQVEQFQNALPQPPQAPGMGGPDAIQRALMRYGKPNRFGVA